ncbi:MAG: hypothetical protein GX126_02420, partial [Bacteroidales bacterium]|nr:hypothetical protein [Bacteroidales bacterium]
MKSKFKYCLIFPLMLLLSIKMQAQLTLSTYIDAGDNNVSEGLYIKSSVLGSYQINKYRVEGGAQFDLKNAGSGFFTGGILIVAREFSINKFQFETQGLFIYNPFSP